MIEFDELTAIGLVLSHISCLALGWSFGMFYMIKQIQKRDDS